MNFYYLSPDKEFRLNNLQELSTHSALVIENGQLYNLSIQSKLFYYVNEESHSIYFADSIRSFLMVTSLELDEELVFFQQNVGFLFAPYTIYKNIYRIPTSTKLLINEEELSIRFERVFPVIGEKELDLSEFERILTRSLVTKADINNIILHGGGADSSLLVAICAKNNIVCESLTCEMTGMETEATLAKKIAQSKGLKHSLHRVEQAKVKQILKQYVAENLEVVADPIMPVMREMLFSLKDKTIIDGQGADSVLLAVPHAKLIRLYSPMLSLLLKLPVKIFQFVPTDKSTNLGRKLYRIKKVIYSLSAKNLVECILISLNFPMIKQSQYLQFAKKELNSIFGAHPDKYKMFIYIFLYCILPVREMQKYEGLDKKGLLFNFPFLNEAFIKYIFQLKTASFFDGRNIKIPVYELLGREMPGFIKKNNTKPFFVKYLSDSLTVDNIYQGKKYPIVDSSNFEFTTYNITLLKAELQKLRD